MNNRWGFTWPANDQHCETKVERLGQFDRARIIGITTPRRVLSVYVSPTGLIRVFMSGDELK